MIPRIGKYDTPASLSGVSYFPIRGIIFPYHLFCLVRFHSDHIIIAMIRPIMITDFPTCDSYCTLGSFGGSQCDAGVSYR